MRAALLFAFACAGGACMDSGSGWPGPGDPGPGGPGTGVYCTGASDCASPNLCTRDHECLPPDQVRSVLTHWTVQGQPAGTQSCTAVPPGELEISYTVTATGEFTGFGPLRCDEGQFLVDLWPARFDHVRVDVQTQTWSGDADLSQDATDAEVTVDLGPH